MLSKFRRLFFRTGLGILLILLMFSSGTVIAFSSLTGPEEARVNWKQESGKTIYGMMVTHGYTTALKRFIQDFETLSGIKVRMGTYPEAEFFKKIMIELSSESPTTDFFMLNSSMVVPYIEGGWVEPLKLYIQDSSLTDPVWYDWEDFRPNLKNATYKDTIYGVPITVDPEIMFYRKDLLASAGLVVPTTMVQLYQSAVKLNTPEKAGILLRLIRGQGAWWPWQGFVTTYGGFWVNEEGSVGLNMPETVAATEMYTKLLQDAGPRGVINYGWYECLSDFQQGKGALYIDAESFVGALEDPEASAVVGKVGYAIMPKGPTGIFAPNGGASWMAGISSFSRNKKAAWLFWEWATSKKVVLEIALLSGMFGRTSTWKEEALQEKYPSDWTKACFNSLESPGAILPHVARFPQIADIADVTLQTVFSRKVSAKEAMDEAQRKTEQVLRK